MAEARAKAPRRTRKGYERLTVPMMVQLAAPHTWAASVMPVLLAAAMAHAVTGRLDPGMTLVLLAICVLMQASVNVLNDYFDYRKGADTAADNVEESDAVLVYHQVDPKSALFLAVLLLAAAFALGLLVILEAGLVPLGIALVGAAVVALYSGGKTPISYLPIGELVSGVVMGGLIPLACFYVLAEGSLSWLVLLWSVPPMIGIGLIMMTNNTCDIEKDVLAGRRTLPVLCGRARARSLYHGLMALWLAAIVAIVALCFPRGCIVLPFMLLASYPLAKGLWGNPLAPPARVGAMGQVCSLNVALGAFYAAALLV